MTKTPYSRSSEFESQNNNSKSNYSLNGNSSIDWEDAIIPIVVDPEVRSPDSSNKPKGLRAKTTALSQELTVLRSNLNQRVGQLQTLIEREGAAAERAELINAITSHMRESVTRKEIFNTAVEDVRMALQTERVIIHQFEPNWSGTTVAESVDPRWLSAWETNLMDPNFNERDAEAYQRGRVLVIPDIYEAGLSEAHISQLELYQVKAKIVAPVFAEKKLIGLLIAHQCSETRIWLDSEIEFFRQIAIQLSYAVDQALLLQNQQKAAQAAQLLNYINNQIRKSASVDEILTSAVEETRQALNCDRMLVFQFDPQWKGTIMAESVAHPWPTALNAQINDPCFAQRYIQPYLRGRVAATNNIYEAGLTECYLGQLEPFKVKANLVAPIIAKNKLMGLFIAHQCSGPRVWTELDIDLVRNIAIQIGYSLDQAILLDEQQRAAAKARFLNEITTKLRNINKIEEVFDTTVEEARVVIQADRVLIYQFDEQWNGTVVAESVERGLPVTLGKKLADPCIFKHYLKSYTRGRVSIINDLYEEGLEECHIKLLEPFEVKANVVAPIIVEGKLHSLLIIHQCSGPRIWSESAINFTKQLAIQMGLTLDQMVLFEKQQIAAQQARRLNQISSQIRESLDPDDILKTAVEETRQSLGVERVVVNQFDDNWKGKIVAESLTGNYTRTLGLSVDDPCLAENYIKPYSQGRMKVTNNIDEGELSECQVKQLIEYQVKAMVVAPIIAKQKLHGLLIVHQCSSTRQWRDYEVELIRQIAIQVGYALDQGFLLIAQRAATQQAQLLGEISSRIRESLDPKQIFQTTVEQVLSLMPADRVMMSRFDLNGHSRIVAEAGKRLMFLGDGTSGSQDSECSLQAECSFEADCSNASECSLQSLQNSAGLTPQMASCPQNADCSIPSSVCPMTSDLLKGYRQGEIQVVEDTAVAKFTPSQIEELEKVQIQAFVVMPILVNQTLYGLIEVHSLTLRKWLDSEISGLKQVALQVGYALEQALLLEQVQQASREAAQISVEQQQQKERLEDQITAFLGEIEDSFEGNLTVRAQVTEGVMGTVADFFNATIESLQQLVVQVQSAANVVSSTAADNEQEVQQLSQEARQQAETITNALKQIQMMADSIQGVAHSAQEAQAKVLHSNEILSEGDAAMNRTVEGIVGIQKTVYLTARKVKNLGEASRKISRVVNLINEFSNQTHVLALNASVESTRTHQEGLGFSTVATEVRTLAEQSASATQEIEQIVEEIQTETKEVVLAMKVGLKRVMVGTKMVKQTRQTLTELVEVSYKIRELVEQIAVAATAQAQTSNQLSSTMQQVAKIADSTSEQSLKVADSFGQLLGVAGELQKGVSQFKVNS